MTGSRARWRRVLATALLGATALATPRAQAEPTGEQRALATSLFKDGKERMAAGDLAAACPRLEESQRLDPGIGTLLNVAICHELQGRSATAWGELHEALALAERAAQPDRVALATEHIEKLQPILSYLLVEVPAAATPALEVRVDGALLARAAWGVLQPVDPGPHRVAASAPGHARWEIEISVVGPSERRTVVVPPLALEPTSLPEPVPPAQAQPQAERATRRDARDASPIRPATVAGWTLGGLGVVTLGVGVGMGVATLDADAESDALCDPTCTPRGYTLNQDAKTSADVSTAAFIIGGAALATGIVLLLTSDARAAARTPRRGAVVAF